MATKRNIVLLFAVVISTFLTSCSQGEVYYRFHHINKGMWYRDSVLVFKIDTANIHPGKKYDITIELTTNHSYPYRNLLLYVEHNITSPVYQSDTLHCLLADEYGRWLGAGTGGLNQFSLNYLTAVVPDSVRIYELKIRQSMINNPLIGVEKAGVKITEVNIGS